MSGIPTGSTGPSMADPLEVGRLSTLVRVVAAIALIGNLATMVLGAAMWTTGNDAFGFTKVAGIGVFIVGVLTLAPGLLLWRAASALRDRWSLIAHPSPRRRAISTAGTVIVSVAWLVPIVVYAGSSSSQPIVAIGVVFGLVAATSAWTARYFAGHRLGWQLAMIALLAAAPGVMLTFTIAQV